MTEFSLAAFFHGTFTKFSKISTGVLRFLATPLRIKISSFANSRKTSIGVFGFLATAARIIKSLLFAKLFNTFWGVLGFSAMKI